MSKELEAQITKAKEAVTKLENKLKGLAYLFTSTYDEKNTKKMLAKQRMDLALLYKSNHQFKEALVQLQNSYEYYNTSDDSFDVEKCMEIAEIQAACSKLSGNSEQQAIFLSVLLGRLPLINHSKYKKNIPTYLDQYMALAPHQDGLNKITYIIENIDKNAFSDANTYKYALNLKAKLCGDLGDFKAVYEAYTLLIEHYEASKAKSYVSNYLSDEEMAVYLNAYSMACYFKFAMNKKAQILIEKQYDTNRYNASNFEIVFESSIEYVDEEALNKVAFLYHYLNKTPPKWFPKCSIQEMNTHSFFSGDAYKKVSIHSNLKPLNAPNEETNNAIEKINSEPEFEKIRKKITMDWEKLGVGGYKEEIEELMVNVFIPRGLSPEQRKMLGLNLPRGCILEGPPGTGKTLIARTIANHFFEEANVSKIKGPELISKFVGQSAENLRNILDKALINPEVTHVVIIDEIDSLVCARSNSNEGTEAQIKKDLTTTLLTYLDGVDKYDNLILIGTTNYYDRLDDALIRPGRLDVKINVGLPKLEDRSSIFKIYVPPLQKTIVSPSLNIELLAKKSDGLSGVGIKSFIDDTVKKYAVSQMVSYDKGKVNYGDINKIVPLEDWQFVNSLDKALANNLKKKSEQELLLARSYCQFNQSLTQKSLNLREMSYTFAYLSPMLISVSGILGAGSTSYALNLFQESPDGPIYMKAGDLVNLSAKEQQQTLDTCFSKALVKGKGVLIIDDLDDIHYCTFNPIIYLRNKLKMALSQGETLKVILVSKKEDTINILFNNQIDCHATIKMPLITKKNEIVALMQSLELEMPDVSMPIEMKARLTITKLKTELLAYCNKTTPKKREFKEFMRYLNALYPDNTDASNASRFFKESLQDETKNVMHSFQINS